MAGIPGAIASVPDGMASGVLAGVSPIHGLYAGMAGRVFGGLQTSTKLMVITTTGASALAAGSAVATVPEADRPAALVMMTLVVGVIMIVAAVLRLGRYTHFVSHSVMTGFLTGVAVNILLGQLTDLTGASADGAVALTEAVDLALHLGTVDVPSLLIGLTAAAILVALGRLRRLALVSALLALIVTTTLVAVLGLDSVAVVSDVGSIPAGFVVPGVPDITLLTPSLVGGAASVAVLILVQGAGVAEATPNPDRSRSDVDTDFTAQGVGNVAAAAFSGMPVGGSLGQTAVNVAAGARTRWASVFSGIWVLVILVACSSLVARVPMPTLAAVLVVAAVGSLHPAQIASVWRSGTTARIALVVTFVATLLLPVTAAIGIGVIVSLLLQLNREALDLRVVRLRVEGDRLVEVPAPARLRDHEVLILDVYGSLFYAGARTLQTHLPDPADAVAPMVVLRLRGRSTFGATFFTVVREYAARLDENGGHLYLSGIAPMARAFWNDERLAAQGVALDTFTATATVGESTLAAYADARVRVARDESPDEEM
ncbi:SulP family inorganic anion transporter [Rhodococcus sp. HNM0569]|uniref:SulP family inorganic anion transporter n=1 Tax=Rhodococcus sp. HNM0569 TaxID=2716340 RepID=UPI001F0EE66A|nr:SulP family inorganic anion transporter [Rhodococcus sp. HNM0569]